MQYKWYSQAQVQFGPCSCWLLLWVLQNIIYFHTAQMQLILNHLEKYQDIDEHTDIEEVNAVQVHRCLSTLILSFFFFFAW